MIIKDKIGWVVCMKRGENSEYASMVCPALQKESPYKYTAISGFVEIFYTKAIAKKIAEELNESWGENIFIVKKAKCSILEK